MMQFIFHYSGMLTESVRNSVMLKFDSPIATAPVIIYNKFILTAIIIVSLTLIMVS